MTEWAGNSAFARVFAKKGVAYLAAPLMSSYCIRGAERALEILNLPDEAYILNVTYELAENVVGMTGDTQLFMTGTVVEGEDPERASARELFEELVVQPKNRPQQLHVAKGVGRDIHWYGYPMRELRALRATDKRAPSRKDGRHKIACVIYGTRSESLALLSKLPVMRSSSDCISGVTCMPANYVKAMLGVISGRYAMLDKFFWRCESQTDLFAFNGRAVSEGLMQRIIGYSATADPKFLVMEGTITESADSKQDEKITIQPVAKPCKDP